MTPSNDQRSHTSSPGPAAPAAWVPVILLTAATALILLFDLDCRFSRLFFTEEGGWVLMDQPLIADLYHYGPWPAIALAAAATLACLAGCAHRRWQHWVRPSLFLLLVMGLGPGLLINGLFKANFGRPRPYAVQEFGRYQEFRPLLKKGDAGAGASFPSGHAAMGFSLMSPYFLLLARRRLARTVLALGLGAGFLVGLARVAAGDHFLGDVLWSAGLVYLSGLAGYYLLRLDRWPPGRQ
jgi:membrane-associated PAP2 superfamily phosphatase